MFVRQINTTLPHIPLRPASEEGSRFAASAWKGSSNYLNECGTPRCACRPAGWAVPSLPAPTPTRAPGACCCKPSRILGGYRDFSPIIKDTPHPHPTALAFACCSCRDHSPTSWGLTRSPVCLGTGPRDSEIPKLLAAFLLRKDREGRRADSLG